MGYKMKAGAVTAKDKDGNSVKMNLVLDRTTEESLAEISALTEAKKTEIQNKGEQTLASIPDDYSDLAESVGEISIKTKWNLCEGAEVFDRKMANNSSQTVGSSVVLSYYSNGYTVKFEVEPNKIIYFVNEKFFNQYGSTGYNGKNSSRFLNFADENNNFIIGYSYPQSGYQEKYSVPNNAKYAYITFTKNDDDENGWYWCTYNAEDNHKDILDLSDGVKARQDINTVTAKVDVLLSKDASISIQSIRKPTFVFEFDDGTDGDVNTKVLFDSYGFKCGFALLADSSLESKKDRYLSYQNEGFEILSHSIDGTAMGTMDAETANTKMKQSYDILTGNGFDITGFVTPSTWLSVGAFEQLKKYYQHGWGHLESNTTEQIHKFGDKDVRQLERWSLQSNTVQQTLAKIDNCVTQNGLLCFYGHSYPQTSDNMTVENMKTILDYIKILVDSGVAKVQTPRDAINDFFAIRYSDFLGLLKS